MTARLDEKDKHILTLALIALLAESGDEEGKLEENTPEFKANVRRVAENLELLGKDNLLKQLLG